MLINSLTPWQSYSLLIRVLFVIRMSDMLNLVLVELGKRVVDNNLCIGACV